MTSTVQVTKTPEPVRDTSIAVGIFHGVVTALGLLGLTTWQTKLNAEAETIISIIGFVVPLVLHYLPAVFVRDKVTPVAAPSAADGTPLVKASPVSTHLVTKVDGIDARAVASVVAKHAATPDVDSIDDDDDPDDPSPDSVGDDADPEADAAPSAYIADHAGKDDSEPNTETGA